MSDALREHMGILMHDRFRGAGILTMEKTSNRYRVVSPLRGGHSYPTCDIALLAYLQEVRIHIYFLESTEET